MDQQQLVTLLGQGGGWAALVWVIYKIGLKLIAAVDRNTSELRDHTKSDLAAQGEVREELVALQTRIDIIADITPIRAQKPPRARTHPEGVPVRAGYYAPSKPPREDE